MASVQRLVKPPSDQDLEERIYQFLRSRDVPDLEKVRVDANNGTVCISGRMSTSRARWLCLNCCRRVAGVVRLVDKLEAENASWGPAVMGETKHRRSEDGERARGIAYRQDGNRPQQTDQGNGRQPSHRARQPASST